MTTKVDWSWAINAVEAGLVVEALGRAVPEPPLDPDVWMAARCAVAAKFLAVSTPRSFAAVGLGNRVALFAEAQAAWAAASEIRTWDPGEDDLDRALAADIVIVTGAVTIARDAIRGGTHLSVIDPAVTLEPDLIAAARVYGPRDLAKVVAGMIDGRQADEITILRL